MSRFKKIWSKTAEIACRFGRFCRKYALAFYKRFLNPPPLVIFLCVITAMPLVIYSLMCLDSSNPLSLIAYLYSAYAFAILCIGFPKMIKRTRELVHGDDVKIIAALHRFMNRHKYTRLYLNDKEFRAKAALYTGFVINLLYAAFRCAAGAYYSSWWLWAIGVYYVVLSVIRLILLKNVRITDKQEHDVKRRIHEYKSYRTCGVMLFLLNAAMLGMTVQMIWQNKGYEYPGFFIYISAMYTFYCFISSIYNAVTFAKRKNPILSAAKNLSLAGALMSLFALQTAMLTAFGDEAQFKRLMNTVTGLTICAFVFAMGLIMIFKANRNLKQLGNHRRQHGQQI